MTLICSSCCSDGVTVSRDVTWPQHPKRLLRALILSCWLCVEYLTIHRRAWRLEGRGSWLDGNCALLCRRIQMRSWNWLFVCFGLEDLTSDLSFLYILQDCMVIAPILTNLQRTFPFPPLSLVHLLDSKNEKKDQNPPPSDRHLADAPGLLWTIKLRRSSSSSSNRGAQTSSAGTPLFLSEDNTHFLWHSDMALGDR